MSVDPSDPDLCECVAGERTKWKCDFQARACTCQPERFGGTYDTKSECALACAHSPTVYWGCARRPNSGKCTKDYNDSQGYASQEECEADNKCVLKYWNCGDTPGACVQRYPPTPDNFVSQDDCMTSAQCKPTESVVYGCNEKNNGRCVIGGTYGKSANLTGTFGYQDCMNISPECKPPVYWGCDVRNSGVCTPAPAPGIMAGNNGTFLTEQECKNSKVCAGFTYDCSPLSNLSGCSRIIGASGRYVSLEECEADPFCKVSWKPPACDEASGLCQGLGLLFFMPYVDATSNYTERNSQLQNLALAPLKNQEGGAGGGRVMLDNFNWKTCTNFHTNGATSSAQVLASSARDYSLKLSVSNNAEFGMDLLLFSTSGSAHMDLNTSYASQLEQSTATIKSIALEGFVGLDLASPCMSSANLNANFRRALLALAEAPVGYADWVPYYEFFGMQRQAGGAWKFLPSLALTGFGSHVLTAMEVGANYLRSARAATESSQTKFALAQNACVDVYVKVCDEFSADTMKKQNAYRNNVSTELVGGQSTARSCTSGDDACIQRFLTSASDPAGQSTPITFHLTPLWDLLPVMFAAEAPEVRARVAAVAANLRRAYVMMSTYFWRCGPGMCSNGTCALVGNEFRCGVCGANTITAPDGACTPKISCSASGECDANRTAQYELMQRQIPGSTVSLYEGYACMQNTPVAPGAGFCISAADMPLYTAAGWTKLA